MFTRKDLFRSNTANKLKIDNTTNDKDILSNMDLLLEYLNDMYKTVKFIITSGYRCEKLNKAVGGTSNSAHMTGYAVDIIPANNMQFDMFKILISDYVKKTEYDQCIIEKNKKSLWIHISIDKRNRKQMFSVYK